MANLMKQRYFNAAFDEKANSAEPLTPGCISTELAEALGELLQSCGQAPGQHSCSSAWPPCDCPILCIFRRFWLVGRSCPWALCYQAEVSPDMLSLMVRTCSMCWVLRDAGMISTLAPPPWLGRMAVLGVPPSYCKADDASQHTADERLAFMVDSEDSQQEPNQPQEQNGVGGGSKSAPSAISQGQQDDPADADFVPIDVAAAQHPEAEAAAGLIQVQPHVQQSEQPALKQRHTQQFPGINAPLPEGADAAAWQVELDKASYVSAMLG